MSTFTAELIRAQAAELRGAELDETRAAEIAADIGKITEAARAVRDRLDFNDEPARFVAALCAPAAAPGKRP